MLRPRCLNSGSRSVCAVRTEAADHELQVQGDLRGRPRSVPGALLTSRIMTSPGTGKYEQLLQRCRDLPPVPTAVAYPCEETALAGAIDAGAQGLIIPILVGPSAAIRDIAKAKNIDLGNTE